MMYKTFSTEFFVLCFAYIDDAVAFSKIAAEVIKYTRHVLDLIRADNLKIGGFICYFLLQRIYFLGRTIEAGWKLLDDNKL